MDVLVVDGHQNEAVIWQIILQEITTEDRSQLTAITNGFSQLTYPKLYNKLVQHILSPCDILVWKRP